MIGYRVGKRRWVVDRSNRDAECGVGNRATGDIGDAEGEVITGVVANIDGNVIDVDSKDYEDLQVNVKRLLGVVQ